MEHHRTSTGNYARSSHLLEQAGTVVPSWVNPTPETRFDRGRNSLGLVSSNTHYIPKHYQSSLTKRLRTSGATDLNIKEEATMLKTEPGTRFQNVDNFIYNGNPLPEPVAIYAVDQGHHQTTSLQSTRAKPTATTSLSKTSQRSRYKFLPDGSIVDFGLRIKNDQLRKQKQMFSSSQPTEQSKMISSPIWTSSASHLTSSNSHPQSFAIPAAFPDVQIARETSIAPVFNTTTSVATTTSARKRLLHTGIPVGHLAMDDSLSHLIDDPRRNGHHKTDDNKIKSSSVIIPTLPLKTDIFTTQVAGLNFTVQPTSTTRRRTTTTWWTTTTTTTTTMAPTTTTPKPTQHPDDVHFYSQGGGKIGFVWSVKIL